MEATRLWRGGDSRNPEKILIFVQDMSRSISPRISLVLMDLSVFVSMINNSTGRIFSLVTLQATLSLTAPKTPFVPPYIHNLLIFFFLQTVLVLPWALISTHRCMASAHAHISPCWRTFPQYFWVSSALIFEFLPFSPARLMPRFGCLHLWSNVVTNEEKPFLLPPLPEL